MQRTGEKLIVSASDLTGFLACRHLTELEKDAAAGRLSKPHRSDPLLDLLSRRGEEHEVHFLEGLRAQGLEVATIPRSASDLDSLQAAESQTIAAMQAGADLIYQATFFDGRWRGHADFLIRLDRPSDLGPHSYEVYDAKLARRPKARAVLQLCVYSEQVARLQGVAPERMHLVLGDRSVQSYRLRDFAAYYRTIKEHFDAALVAEGVDTYPDPVEHCQICRWWSHCMDRRRRDDHLSLVAEIRRDQIKKLNAEDVATVESLAERDATARVAGIAAPTFARLQDQAAMQVLGRTSGRPEYKVLDPPGPELGLEALPEPSRADLFFDIEGDPYAADEGLQFLFGLSELVEGELQYRTWWAHDPGEEKTMVEAFVDFVTERYEADPSMHVYHYGAAEPSSLKRLVCRYATREEELDRLLRAKVFVDLYRVVRQGLRISEESYSIKRLEAFYGFERSDPITGQSSAIVEYERYLETDDETILDNLAAYNRADCDTMFFLRNWLEERRSEAEQRAGDALSRPASAEPEASETLSEALQRTAALVDALTVDVPIDPERRSEEQHARWLLAQLLGWHRRETKSEWWAYFERLKMTPQELVEDTESLGGLNHEGVEYEEGRSLVHRLTFPPQEHKLSIGDRCIDPATGSGVRLIEINDTNRYVLIKRGRNRTDHPEAIVPGKPYDTVEHRQALERLAECVLERGVVGEGPQRAIRDLLAQHPPRVAGKSDGEELRASQEQTLEAARRLGLELEDSYLAIQGPPGTGKTYTGAHVICSLVEAGHRVGVTATSHKVIVNLLEETLEVAKKRGIQVRALQKAGETDACTHPSVEVTNDNAVFTEKWGSGEFQVAAGTAWMFARQECSEMVHTLVIDEAGQFSLANAAAVAGAARNLVLLGDPQQLSQPSKGVHPPGSERSILEQILADRANIPSERGLFLEKTWRMHPAVCTFVSDAFYEGRLTAEPHCTQQTIIGNGPLAGSGLTFVPVAHSGNRVASPEEAAVIAELVQELIDRLWVDKNGKEVRLKAEDILVVAPFNRQVAVLRSALPAKVPVGTVDKFQGQEGAVTIYSLTTSDPEEIPRNFEFLYSHNRLNVAVSRARARAIVVGNPALLGPRCNTPEQMRLANALCLFREYADAPA